MAPLATLWAAIATVSHSDCSQTRWGVEGVLHSAECSPTKHGRMCAQVRAFGQQLLEAVAYMHELRLIHTDLKPENILLTSLEIARSTAPADARCACWPASPCTQTRFRFRQGPVKASDKPFVVLRTNVHMLAPGRRAG